MKKNSLFILSAFIATVFLCSCQKAPSYQISGTINMDSGMMYLQSFRNKMFFVVDSAPIKQGQFLFTGKAERPDLFGLTLNRNETFSPHYIFIENSPISVEIDTTGRGTAIITGSAENDLFEYYKNNRKGFDIAAYIKENPKSPVVAYILYREFSTDLSATQLEEHVALFDPTVRDISFLKELEEIIATKRSVEPGQTAPSFSGITPDELELNLESFRGNYLMLDFWASWCGPCRRSNPNKVKAFEMFHEQGFQILSVSLDRKKEDWLKGIETDGLVWNHVSDLKFWDSAPAKLYGVRSIPSNFLIDPNGIIIASNLHGDELINKLAEIYNK